MAKMAQIELDYGREQFSEKDKYRTVFRNGNKSIELIWPYEIGEVFFTFKAPHGDFEDWCECYEEEDLSDFADYLELVATRFLSSNTRIVTKGLILRSQILEFEDEDGIWVNILAP